MNYKQTDPYSMYVVNLDKQRIIWITVILLILLAACFAVGMLMGNKRIADMPNDAPPQPVHAASAVSTSGSGGIESNNDTEQGESAFTFVDVNRESIPNIHKQDSIEGHHAGGFVSSDDSDREKIPAVIANPKTVHTLNSPEHPLYADAARKALNTDSVTDTDIRMHTPSQPDLIDPMEKKSINAIPSGKQGGVKKAISSVPVKKTPSKKTLSRSSSPKQTVSMTAPKVFTRDPRLCKEKPYSVQVASFMEKKYADELYHALRNKGYTPYIIKSSVNGKSYYRIRIGVYQKEPDARCALKEMKLHHSGAFLITRIQK